MSPTEIRDYYTFVKRYAVAKEKLKNDDRLPAKNRALCYEWLLQKEKNLKDGKSKEIVELNAHRNAKTLCKYCTLFTNICYWFPDLTNISKEELEKFKDDFLNDRIKSLRGKVLKDKNDYFKKIIRSEFFKKFLGYRDMVEEVFSAKLHVDKTRVQFITKEDLDSIISVCRYNEHKAYLYILFSTGVRAGTFLNLKVKDFELRYNSDTNMSYYMCHVKKEYTKSNDDRSVPIVIPEANDYITKLLSKMSPDDYICDIKYDALRSLLLNLGETAKIKTKPDNKIITPHILRKSCALFLLNQGYSLDQVKSFLGHKPSSDAIDAYANYSGLMYEPQITKVQTDEYLKLKQKINEQELKMSVLMQQNDEIKANQNITNEVLLKMAEHIDDKVIAKDTKTLKAIYSAIKKQKTKR